LAARSWFALLAFALLAGSAGCGGDEETTGGGGTGPTVDVAAAPDNTLAYEQQTLDAPSGDVTFAFNNPAQIVHDFCIEDGAGGELGCTEQISEGISDLSVTLEPGEYTFYCSVAGHREDGMVGTLTVAADSGDGKKSDEGAAD
jgi:plastocyanin